MQAQQAWYKSYNEDTRQALLMELFNGLLNLFQVQNSQKAKDDQMSNEDLTGLAETKARETEVRALKRSQNAADYERYMRGMTRFQHTKKNAYIIIFRFHRCVMAYQQALRLGPAIVSPTMKQEIERYLHAAQTHRDELRKQYETAKRALAESSPSAPGVVQFEAMLPNFSQASSVCVQDTKSITKRIKDFRRAQSTAAAPPAASAAASAAAAAAVAAAAPTSYKDAQAMAQAQASLAKRRGMATAKSAIPLAATTTTAPTTTASTASTTTTTTTSSHPSSHPSSRQQPYAISSVRNPSTSRKASIITSRQNPGPVSAVVDSARGSKTFDAPPPEDPIQRMFRSLRFRERNPDSTGLVANVVNTVLFGMANGYVDEAADRVTGGGDGRSSLPSMAPERAGMSKTFWWNTSSSAPSSTKNSPLPPSPGRVRWSTESHAQVGKKDKTRSRHADKTLDGAFLARPLKRAKTTSHTTTTTTTTTVSYENLVADTYAQDRGDVPSSITLAPSFKLASLQSQTLAIRPMLSKPPETPHYNSSALAEPKASRALALTPGSTDVDTFLAHGPGASSSTRGMPGEISNIPNQSLVAEIQTLEEQNDVRLVWTPSHVTADASIPLWIHAERPELPPFPPLLVLVPMSYPTGALDYVFEPVFFRIPFLITVREAFERSACTAPISSVSSLVLLWLAAISSTTIL